MSQMYDSDVESDSQIQESEATEAESQREAYEVKNRRQHRVVGLLGKPTRQNDIDEQRLKSLPIKSRWRR